MATCELPAFPPSAVPPGATIRILASLRLDGGARTLAAPVGAAVHLVAPDADDATFRLASDDDGVAVTDANGAAPPAVAVPARMGEEEEEESKSAVAGDAEGGAVVVLVLRAAEAKEAKEAKEANGANGEDGENGENGQGSNSNASSAASSAARTFSVFSVSVSSNDAACAFGTVRGVSARRVGARAYACVSPAAPRDDASVPARGDDVSSGVAVRFRRRPFRARRAVPLVSSLGGGTRGSFGVRLGVAPERRRA